MILEMVRHVVPAQLAEVRAIDVKVMQGIVGHVVIQIAKQKARQ